MDYFALRRQALLKALKKDGVDALLVTNPTNVTYLTGFTGDSSYFVASPKAQVLVSDTRFEEQIREECPGLDAAIRSHDKTTPEAAAEAITKAGLKSVALEADHATLAFAEHLREKAPKATFTSLTGRVEALRATKDMGEIEQIRAAVRAAERAFGMFLTLLQASDTEKMMADALEGYIRRAGGRGSSFPPIVAAGERGALPHAPPTDRRLGDVSKLLVDWGADLGYKSDITRVIRSPFPPAPLRKTKQERTAYHFDEVYEAVCRAHDAAVAEIRAGVPGKAVDAAARRSPAETRLRDNPEVNLAEFFHPG